MKESFFLTLANLFPYSRTLDNYRCFLLKMAGVGVGGDCIVWGGLRVRPHGGAKNITIGSNVFINTDVRFGAAGKVTIGDDVLVGPRVMFETVNHALEYSPGNTRKAMPRPITVERGVWIGAGAIILPGVIIGEGAVVAAGSVVTHHVASATLIGGVPAKFIKKIGGEQEL
ncbi:MAG: acyltransferase [Desulfobulbaceae bacterium]|nr:MAG: acyltransferase [Desulfobulbaceae bacterium]